MLQVQLLIEGQHVDLYKDESITLTQSIQDVRDIEKIFTDFSRTFNVPASKTNNKIFKHFYNYHIDGFDARVKQTAQILINHKPFKKGKIKLEGVTLKNNEAHTYRLTFYGNTVTLPDLLGEDRLANLTELSAFDFRYNDTNIQQYISNGLDQNIGIEQIEDAIVFPLISHTSRLIYDSSKNEENNLYVTGSENGVSFTQLKPALRLHAIIKAIELHYDLEFSTDFFNTTNSAYYNLYLWMHTKAGGLFVDQNKSHQISGYSTVDNVVNGLSIRNNYYRVVNRDRHVRFDLTYTVKPASASTEYNLVIHQNGEEFKRFDGLQGDTKNGEQINASGGFVSSEADPIEVQVGEYSAYIETEDAASFDLEIKVKRIRKQRTSDTHMTASLSTFSDTNIAITSQLPDIKVLDLLTGLFKMFNLTAFVNDAGTVVVQTLDQYYASSDNTFDVTEFISTDESQVDAPIPYRQVNLSYEGLDTFLAKNFKQMNNKGWGTLEYQSEAKFEGQTYEIELPFEHMMFERLRDANNFDLTGVQWGWFVDEKQETSSGLPLLFYAVTNSSTTVPYRNIAGTKVDIAAPYMPSNSAELWSSYRKEHMEQSLNFHSEFDEWAGPPNEKSLFDTYYKSYLADLFDVRKRITKVSAYLPLRITQNLSLADAIVIFDKLYRINTITTNFETNKSQLELTNVLDQFVPTVDIGTVEIEISSSDITADTTAFTADRGDVTADGFVQPPETTPVPNTVPSNTITQPSEEPCEVTAASISEGAHIGETDKITFKYSISEAGKLCGQDNIDEYGFLIASSSSVLTSSTDIDTLKANSSIQVINVTRSTGQPSLIIGEKLATVDGLTDPATRFGRFYVRTNTSENFNEADVISDVFSESTVATIGTAETLIYMRTAGFGPSFGYSTIPTLATIRSNYYVTNFNADCGETATLGTAYHNGAGEYPEVGDNFKFYESYTYAGGSNSAPSSYDDATNIYYAIAIATNETVVGTTNFRGTIERYIVVEYDTAEIVAKYSCP